MERIMTLDEEDIIRLIAKSLDVDFSAVNLRVSSDTVLYETEIDEKTVGVVDTGFKLYAKVSLPVTQIDGTEVDDADITYCDEDDHDDSDGTDC